MHVKYFMRQTKKQFTVRESQEVFTIEGIFKQGFEGNIGVCWSVTCSLKTGRGREM